MCHWPKREIVTKLIELLLNFQWKKKIKIHYLLHLMSKNYKINSIKLYSLNILWQYQKITPIFYKFSILVILKFWWWKYSVFNSFCTIHLNIAKLTLCTFIHWRLMGHICFSMVSKAWWRAPKVGDLNMTNKQHKQISFFNK